MALFAFDILQAAKISSHDIIFWVTGQYQGKNGNEGVVGTHPGFRIHREDSQTHC